MDQPAEHGLGASNYAQVTRLPPVEPVEVVKAFGAAWEAHDLEAALAFLTEDCIFDSTAPSPDGEMYVGPKEVRRAWEPIFEDPSSRFETKKSSLAANASFSDGAIAGMAGTCAGSTFRGERRQDSRELPYVKG